MFKNIFSFSPQINGEVDLILRDIPKDKLISLTEKKVGIKIIGDLSNLTSKLDIVCEIKANIENCHHNNQWYKYQNLLTYLNKCQNDAVHSQLGISRNNSKIMAIITNGHLHDFLLFFEKKSYQNDILVNTSSCPFFYNVFSSTESKNISDPNKKTNRLSSVVEIFNKNSIPVIAIYIPQIYLSEYMTEFLGVKPEKLRKALECDEKMKKIEDENATLKTQVVKLTEENTQLKTQVDELKRDNTALNEKMEIILKKLEILGRE